MTDIHFKNGPLEQLVREKILSGFTRYGLQERGIDGDNAEAAPESFEAWDGDTFAGAAVGKVFWGQLHVKWLYVEEAYRTHGLATQLMAQLETYAKEQGCDFMFVETLSFQALDFYQKVGFQLDFTRHGHIQDISFHYLSKYI